MKVKIIKQNEVYAIGEMVNQTGVKDDICSMIKDVENSNFCDIDSAKEYIYMALDAVTREYYGEDDLRTFIDHHTEVTG